MSHKISIAVVLLICNLFISCKSETKNIANIKENPKFYLELYYLTPGTTSPMRLPCGYISGGAYKNRRYYKKIDEKNIVEKFMKYYENLESLSEKDTAYDVDSRIEIALHRENKTDLICLGEYSRVCVNGTLKKDSPDLLKLVKDNLWTDFQTLK